MPNRKNWLSQVWQSLKRPVSSTWDAGKPLAPAQDLASAQQYQYTPAVNVVITPRSESLPDGDRQTQFDVLRRLADNCDLVRIAIEYRKEQIAGIDWEIVNRFKSDKSDYSSDIEKVRAFFEKPDKVNTFYDWIGMLLEDVLAIDAATIFKYRTKGGDLLALRLVDGTTIKPLIDNLGYTPLPPDKAYQQILWGRPESNFTIDELIYKPKNRRSFTPYGFAPAEYIIMAVNLLLRKQRQDIAYHTEGTLPDGGAVTMPETWTPQQITEFEKNWNLMMEGDAAQRSKLKFLPAGSNYIPIKKYEFSREHYEWLARMVALGFGMPLSLLIKDQNRAVAEEMGDQQAEAWLQAMQRYLSDLFNDIIQNVMGYRHLRWKWANDETDDVKLEIEKNTAYVKQGIYSIDEVRVKEGKEPLIEGGIPPMVQIGNEIVFLTADFVGAQINKQTLPRAEPEPAKEMQEILRLREDVSKALLSEIQNEEVVWDRY